MWYCIVSSGMMWCIVSSGMMWYCIVSISVMWYCIVSSGIMWCCIVSSGMMWYCIVSSGMMWYCIVSISVMWYCIVSSGIMWSCVVPVVLCPGEAQHWQHLQPGLGQRRHAGSRRLRKQSRHLCQRHWKVSTGMSISSGRREGKKKKKPVCVSVCVSVCVCVCADNRERKASVCVCWQQGEKSQCVCVLTTGRENPECVCADNRERKSQCVCVQTTGREKPVCVCADDRERKACVCVFVQTTGVEELWGNSDQQQADPGAQRAERRPREAGLPGSHHQGGPGLQQPGGGHLLPVLHLQVGTAPIWLYSKIFTDLSFSFQFLIQSNSKYKMILQ